MLFYIASTKAYATHKWLCLLTSHSIVGESLAELIDHDEEYAEWIATALHLLVGQNNYYSTKRKKPQQKSAQSYSFVHRR